MHGILAILQAASSAKGSSAIKGHLVCILPQPRAESRSRCFLSLPQLGHRSLEAHKYCAGLLS